MCPFSHGVVVVVCFCICQQPAAMVLRERTFFADSDEIQSSHQPNNRVPRHDDMLRNPTNVFNKQNLDRTLDFGTKTFSAGVAESTVLSSVQSHPKNVASTADNVRPSSANDVVEISRHFDKSHIPKMKNEKAVLRIRPFSEKAGNVSRKFANEDLTKKLTSDTRKESVLFNKDSVQSQSVQNVIDNTNFPVSASTSSVIVQQQNNRTRRKRSRLEDAEGSNQLTKETEQKTSGSDNLRIRRRVPQSKEEEKSSPKQNKHDKVTEKNRKKRPRLHTVGVETASKDHGAASAADGDSANANSKERNQQKDHSSNTNTAASKVNTAVVNKTSGIRQNNTLPPEVPSPFNLTEYESFWKEIAFQSELQREAQWAYVCLVLLILLMLWAMWYLGGLERCRYRPETVKRFDEEDNVMDMKDVLWNKRHYLPMFNEPDWEEVLLADRGTNT